MNINTAVVRSVLAALCLSLLSACGGGGGGGGSGGTGGGGTSTSGGYSISLSTQALTFSGTQYSSIPAQTVTATFKGDGVLVGTRPGEVLPQWLRVSNTGVTGDRAVFSVEIVPGSLAAGTHSTALRFVSGNANGSNTVYQELAITLNLREGFRATAPDINFSVVEGGPFTPAEGVTIDITGENISWSVDGPSWLHFSATSGTQRGSIVVTPNPTGLAPGRYQQIFGIKDSISGNEWRFLGVVQVVVPQLTASATRFDITLNSQTPEADTHHGVVISDSALGQNLPRAIAWTAESNSSLLHVAPSSGTTAGAPTTLTLDLDRSELNALRTGVYTPAATIKYGYYENRYLNFNVSVRLPRANAADPYFLRPGTPDTIRLLGEDFTQDDLELLRINNQPLSALGASASLTSAREIALTLPALAANDYEVSFQNQLGLSRSAAAIKVAAAPLTPGAGEMVGTGNRMKLLYDAIRSRLYGIDTLNSEIERYEWNGTQWNALPSLSIALLQDAALLRDGRHMVAVSYGAFHSVDLDSGVATPMPGNPNPACVYSHVVTPTTGTVFASLNSSCSASDIGELDLLSGAMKGPLITNYDYRDWNFYRANLATSGDGRVVAIGNTSTSGGNYVLFDTSTRSVIDKGNWSRYGVYYYYRFSLDRTGAKVLINNTSLRDQAGITLGRLPTNSAATLSADGSRAYVYVHGAGGTGHVAVFNTSAAVGANSTFPQIGADIPVPEDMGTPDRDYDYGNVTSFGSTLSADERLLFVAGSTRIVAVELP
ncbi:hypothetical protein [Steroidobacter cummioxidans]|uniref:hypothetical protein n=1 Tax=Steroidobacter cummioxidans TaxID=1803913 RepID=UPI000E31E0D0|nr:hypothetical protein [Steroidobacter cummioxidans]